MDRQERKEKRENLALMDGPIVVGQCKYIELLDTCDALEDERDRYKARCEAMERALKELRCANPECAYYLACSTCVIDADECSWLVDDDFVCGLECDKWQFDEARFAPEKEANHEAD